MKQFLHLTFFFCLLFSFSAVVTAQEKIVISTDPPPAVARFPVLKVVGRAKVTYNSRKQESVAQTDFLHVFGTSLDGIVLWAGFTSQGKKVVRPENITLEILPAAKDRTYVDNRIIKIFLDGRIALDSTSTFVSANSDGSIIDASLKQEIPYELFIKLSKAKQITMQVGPTTFELKGSDIEAFSDLLKTIEN
jgi:hypothetical protein